MIEEKKFLNEFDEDDREIKKKYLYQLTAIIRFVDERIHREVQYRKDKSMRIRDELENYWRDTNLHGYTSEISGMPRNPSRSNTSSTERLAMDKIKMEETLRDYHASKSDEAEEAAEDEIDLDKVRAYVFETMGREHPVYREVYNEVLDTIHSVPNAKGMLLLEDRYIKGMEIKAIILERGERRATVYEQLNATLDSIRIPPAQHNREWIVW